MTAGDGDVTNGELMRRIDQLSLEMNRRFAELNGVGIEVFEEYRRSAGQRTGAVEKDVAEIQGRNARNFQLIMASLVLPILVALIVAALIAKGSV